jgi:serine/threonine-protein kinase
LIRGHVCPGTALLDSLTVAMHGTPPASADALTQPAAANSLAEGELTRLVADPLLPDVVGGFRLDYVAGTGGMGTVYRAHDERLGSPVAVKVMKRAALADPRALERALREVTAAARVQHPGIAPVLGHGQLADGRPWLATPFFEGSALDALLAEQGRLPWQLVVPVLAELASVLGAAHAAGVVHRDVKPANVFCARHSDGTVGVKLLDFGLALLGDSSAGIPQTSVQSAPGTPDFLAPEQALGQSVGAGTDLYALGITAFQLLTGRLPFSDSTGTAIMRRQVFEQAPRVRAEAKVPAVLDRLIDRLLAKQPDQRPASAAEVRETLDRIRFTAPPREGLLERLAGAWARTHPPSVLSTMRGWVGR